MNRHTKLSISIVGLVVIASCAARVANEPRSNSTSAGNKPASANVAAVIPPEPMNTTAEPGPTPAPVVQVNKDPKTLVLAFYEYYLDGFPRIESEGPTFAKFLTSRFFKVAKAADDYDPFLDAQDFDETWTKNSLSASDPVIRGDKATVDVLLKGKTMTWTLRVTVLKQRDIWKIDGVKNKES